MLSCDLSHDWLVLDSSLLGLLDLPFLVRLEEASVRDTFLVAPCRTLSRLLPPKLSMDSILAFSARVSLCFVGAGWDLVGLVLVLEEERANVCADCLWKKKGHAH